jgi:nitric oxide dioxygenase
MNEHKNIKGMIEYPKEGILSKQIFKSKALDATLFCMTGGSELSKHTSTREGLMIVIEGEGSFSLNRMRIIMKPGVVIHMDKKAAHSLKAKSNLSFALILFS